MEHVDFGYVGENGETIYRICFDKYIGSRFTLERPKSEWSKLVKQTEAVFGFLVEQGINNGDRNFMAWTIFFNFQNAGR